MSIVKLFTLLPKRGDITRHTFHDHWRHPHGTWARDLTGSLRYVQSHRIDTPHLGSDQNRFEAVAEIWREAPDPARSRAEEPLYRDYLKADEQAFLDVAAVRFVFTDEEVVQSGPHPDIPPDNADARWWARDAALSIKLIQMIEAYGVTSWAQDDDLGLGLALGALRHVRCHVDRRVHRPDAKRPPAAIGFRELWWPTLSAFEAGVRTGAREWKTLMTRTSTSFAMLCQAERLK